jgi:hypothetical protein
MNFDRSYWILIAAALSCATIASACTLYLASVQEHFMECNSTSAACFAVLGGGGAGPAAADGGGAVRV